VATDPFAVSSFFPLPGDNGAGRRARDLIAPDKRIKRRLDGGEPLLARRTESTLTRVSDSGLESDGLQGSVYLTDRRLIHLGAGPTVDELAIDLGQVTELSLSGVHLLITVRPHRGFMLDVESPIDFRAQMALAISALRGR
jgi:hypothetical protein